VYFRTQPHTCIYNKCLSLTAGGPVAVAVLSLIASASGPVAIAVLSLTAGGLVAVAVLSLTADGLVAAAVLSLIASASDAVAGTLPSLLAETKNINYFVVLKIRFISLSNIKILVII